MLVNRRLRDVLNTTVRRALPQIIEHLIEYALRVLYLASLLGNRTFIVGNVHKVLADSFAGVQFGN